MKRGIFTSATVLLLFSSCRKEDMAASITTSQNTPYVSTWETAGSNWQSTQADGTVTYSHTRNLAQLNNAIVNDGVVAVYTKGYTAGDQTITRPMGMPFLLYGSDQQAVPYSWEIVKGNQRIEVMVKMAIPQQEQFVQNQNAVQFRYIVVPREFILKNNLSVNQVGKMSYQQLSELLNFEI